MPQAKSKSAGNSAKTRSSTTKSRNGSSPSSSRGKNGASKRSSAQGGKRGSPSSGSSKTAIERTKDAGSAAADAASKAKVPLIAGATALAGAAAGVALKDRIGIKRSKNPLRKLPGVPKAKVKIDLDTVKSTADRVGAYSQQASDIAAAVEKTRKKNG